MSAASMWKSEMRSAYLAAADGVTGLFHPIAVGVDWHASAWAFTSAVLIG